MDPLRLKMNPFSLWHYQPAPPSSDQTASFRLSEHDLRVLELQDEITNLESEVRSGSSRRSVDDIVADLEKGKGQLRKLQWKKWLSW
jgi:hypothetical protein